MTTGIIIQTRISSTRLPGKALLPLAGKPLTEQLVIRMKKVSGADRVILAIADEPAIEPLLEIARRQGIDYFVGSLPHVLERFYGAARQFNLDIILRATGDNPLIDIVSAGLAIAMLKTGNYDYVNMAGLPLGCGLEGFTAEAFERVYRESTETFQHEHVTPYFYQNPDKFRLGSVGSPYGDHHALRLTVDEERDYRLMRHIYETLHCSEEEYLPLERVLAYAARNPDEFSGNRDVHQKKLGE